jgi:HTH-type transcriptional regulator / antitoxin HigA
MQIRPIHTPADYKSTLKEVSALVDTDPPRGTPDADRLGILGTLLQAYETQHYTLELCAPLILNTS